MKTAFVAVSLLGLAVGQSLDPQCASSAQDGAASLTVFFTKLFPPQIAPTSTVYGAIMTSYLNVVDCRYVTVENINGNQPQSGMFTARTTHPVLTVYQVGCMVETSQITRRDLEMIKTGSSQPTLPAQQLEKRTTLETSVADQVFSMAERLSYGIDPTFDNITVREYKYLEQINTAIFSLNLVNLGFDLDKICQWLRDPSLNERLEDSLINVGQASNIICFAAQYGLYFGMSNAALLADLAALEYALQLHTYPESLQELCNGLDYTAASFLGIDTDGIRTYICNGTAGTNSTLSTPSAAGTATLTGTGSRGTGTTAVMTTGTVSIVFGSDGPIVSSATSAAGTIAPWDNTTMPATVTATVNMTTITVGSGATTTSTLNPRFLPAQVRRRERYHL